MNKNIELLSPSGDFERARYAIENGANAIYVGGEKFSARSGATNFTNEELREVVAYANLRDVKVFLAVNTLIKEEELEELVDFLQESIETGVHALIIQDIAIAKILKHNKIDIKLHASTQLTAHSLDDVLELERLGFSRVVLSRELSIDEIKYICDNTDVEIEVFCHGANCVSYSGQCLMSSLNGGRSGNRGRCAQPCRLKYSLNDKDDEVVQKGYLLSPRDTFSVDLIESLIKAGVCSFKIEGRMKNKTYVSAVTKAYRQKIDEVLYNTSFDKENITDITQAFNRGGKLSNMYLTSNSTEDLMSTSTPKSTGILIGEVVKYANDYATIKTFAPINCADGIEIWTKDEYNNVGTNINKASVKGESITLNIIGNISKGDKVYKSFDKALNDKYKNLKETRQAKVLCDVKAKINEPFEIKLTYKGITVSEKGNIVESASNDGTSFDLILQKLKKTGGTPFKFEFNNLSYDEKIYIQISAINETKKQAIEKLKTKILNQSVEVKDIILPSLSLNRNKEKLKFVFEVNTIEQLNHVIKFNENGYVHRIVLNTEQIDIKDVDFSKINSSVYLKLPRILNSSDYTFLEELVKSYDDMVDGYTVCTYGQLAKIESLSSKEIATDLSFNTFNSQSFSSLARRVDTVCLSPELNKEELKSLSFDKSEIIFYGYLPSMTTKICPVGVYAAKKDNTKFCKLKGNKDKYSLVNYDKKQYRCITNCNFCYATILNDNSINGLNDELLDKLKFTEYAKVIFTIENENEMDEVFTQLLDYKNGNSVKEKKNNFSGHFYKGVF